MDGFDLFGKTSRLDGHWSGWHTSLMPTPASGTGATDTQGVVFFGDALDTGNGQKLWGPKLGGVIIY